MRRRGVDGDGGRPSPLIAWRGLAALLFVLGGVAMVVGGEGGADLGDF